MPTYTFDFRKTKPAEGGNRADYIKPGRYKFKVTAYSDKSSQGGKEMHTFTSEVVSKGPEQGKKIIDRFAMPKTAKESQFPVERLLSFFLAMGAAAQGKQFKLDPSKTIGKTYDAEISDQREEARTVDGTTYPARTVSTINRYIFGDDDDEDADDDDEDEDEEEDEDEDDDEDEDEEEDEDDDEDDDEEEEEEEEPEPVKKSSKSKSKTAAKAPAKKAATKTKAKAAPAKSSKKSSKSKKDDDDFPFD